MKRLFLIGALAIATAAAALGPTPAQAQSPRTFVSGHGADTGTCALAAPCRSFSYAITQTNAGGEITVLDPAGYGSVTINKAMSIVNDGVGEAGVTVTTAVDAITVAAGATDVVNLRGLTLVGGAIGNNGITLTAAGTLNVQNSVIRGFTTGMNMGPAGPNRVNVSDTIVSNNNNGILYFPTGARKNDTIFFERVQALGNQTNGFIVGGDDMLSGFVSGMAADCAATGNGSSGFAVSSVNGGGNATFTIVGGRAIGNTSGVSTSTTVQNATLVLTGTTIAGNTAGYVFGGAGAIDTYGDNHILDTNNTGSLTLLTDQ